MAGEQAAHRPIRWLVDALYASGQQRDAAELFERLPLLRNDVGLLSEEWDPGAQRQLGNAPRLRGSKTRRQSPMRGLALSRSSRALLIAGLGRPPVPFHAYEVQSQVAHRVEHAIEMRLIADLSDQGGLLDTGLHVKPVEGGPEPRRQASPDRDPVSGRRQAASFW
jgi:hypothetical protein